MGECSRYDYEAVDSAAAEKMMYHVREVIKSTPPGTDLDGFVLQEADEYTYTVSPFSITHRPFSLSLLPTDGPGNVLNHDSLRKAPALPSCALVSYDSCVRACVRACGCVCVCLGERTGVY